MEAAKSSLGQTTEKQGQPPADSALAVPQQLVEKMWSAANEDLSLGRPSMPARQQPGGTAGRHPPRRSFGGGVRQGLDLLAGCTTGEQRVRVPLVDPSTTDE
jgi:hypothetical protein